MLPKQEGETSKNMKQNLNHKFPPQTFRVVQRSANVRDSRNLFERGNTSTPHSLVFGLRYENEYKDEAEERDGAVEPEDALAAHPRLQAQVRVRHEERAHARERHRQAVGQRPEGYGNVQSEMYGSKF